MNADAVAALRERFERLAAEYELRATQREASPSWEFAAEDIRAVLAAPLPSDTETTFAWLIERGQPERQVPTVWWWLAAGGREGWTEVASEAFRFESREAAEEIITAKFTPLARARYGGPSARAVEHGFHRGAPLPSDTPADGLDAGLLARAIVSVDDMWTGDYDDHYGRAVLAEYAALALTQEPRPGDDR